MNLYGFVSDVKALAGMLFGMNPKTVITYVANDAVDYGRGLFMKDGKVVDSKLNNKAVIDLSDYTTSGKNIIATINNVVVTTLATTGTIADDVATLVASINDEVPGVTASVITGNKIQVVTDNDLALTVVLSYDGSDVTSSKVALSSELVFVGVSVFHQNSFRDSRGFYVPQEAVACLTDGFIWVKLDDNVEPKDMDSAYVTNEGVFTTESSGNTLVGKFKSGAENGLALIEVAK